MQCLLLSQRLIKYSKKKPKTVGIIHDIICTFCLCGVVYLQRELSEDKTFIQSGF